MMTVHQVAGLAGVSERTLRYYDQLGLLPPASASEAGYRLYSEADLRRLQRILFLRELDFPLKEIAPMLLAEERDQHVAVERHRELLMGKAKRLQGLIDLCERILKGENDMSLQEFDNAQVNAMRDEYAEEAKARWGNTDAYKESTKRSASYSKADWEHIKEEQAEIFSAFAALVGQDPVGAEVRALVEKWRAHLNARFYPCNNELLKGLGAMYMADERFQKTLNAYGNGTAALMSEAFRRVDE